MMVKRASQNTVGGTLGGSGDVNWLEGHCLLSLGSVLVGASVVMGVTML